MESKHADQLPSWVRKYYEVPAGNPFVFFVVYGEFPAAPAVSRSKYRYAGIPDGIEVRRYTKQAAPEALARFLDGRPWDDLQTTKPELSVAISRAPECFVIRGEIEDRDNLDYLRDAVGFVTYLLDNGGVCVYDPTMFNWWAPEEWRATAFEPEGPVPRHHVVILVSEESRSGEFWLHTRGMRKFGRPDLSMRRVTPEHQEAVVDLLNRFIEFLAFGGSVPDGQEIRMASLREGLRCYNRGHVDDPDFNNVHLEILQP